MNHTPLSKIGLLTLISIILVSQQLIKVSKNE